jgi:hypothetical protein
MWCERRRDIQLIFIDEWRKSASIFPPSAATIVVNKARGAGR